MKYLMRDPCGSMPGSPSQPFVFALYNPQDLEISYYIMGLCFMHT